jgi:DNA-binding NarL/FixJ family response regulator
MRAVIGEDQALMREGLALLLERDGFDVVARVDDADALVRTSRAHQPDLVVADIRMPPNNADDGLRAALEIRRTMPKIAILVLSHHVQPRYATELVNAGAERIGYLLKQRVADVETFCSDVRRICAGGVVLDPEVIASMLARVRRDDPIERVTHRQREVLALMAEGRSNQAIAKKLVLTEKAVVKHVSHVYDELNLPPCPDDHRRVLAVVRYLTSESAAALREAR